MYENVFTEKDVIPSETLIKETLQSNYVQLMEIRQYIEHTIGEIREEWKYYGKKIGWNLKKYYKKRNLLFIIIYDGCFKVALVFGEKAVNAINDSNISPELKTALAEARKYAEGRGLSIVVEDARYLGDIKELLQIKLNN